MARTTAPLVLLYGMCCFQQCSAAHITSAAMPEPTTAKVIRPRSECHSLHHSTLRLHLNQNAKDCFQVVLLSLTHRRHLQDAACAADLNGDGDVNIVDLLVLLGAFDSSTGGTSTTRTNDRLSSPCVLILVALFVGPGDINGDEVTNVVDVLGLLGLFGGTCESTGGTDYPIGERLTERTIITVRAMDFARQKSVYGCKF